MDPATWSWLTCTWLIQTSIGGIVGNRIDAGAMEVWTQGWQAFSERMRGDYRAPVNQDLAVAVHRSFLLAQLSLIHYCLNEFTGGTWTEHLPNAPAVMQDYSQADVDQLEKKLKQVKAAIRALDRGNCPPIPVQALEMSEALVQADRAAIEESQQRLRAELPALFEPSDPEAYRLRAVAPDTGLLERVSAYFAFQLKTNPSLRGLFQNQLLVQINERLQGLSVQSIELSEIEGSLKQIAIQLPDVLAGLNNLRIAVEGLGKSADEVERLVDNRTSDLITMSIFHSHELAEIKRMVSDLSKQSGGQVPTIVSNAVLNYRYHVFLSHHRKGSVARWVRNHFFPLLEEKLTDYMGDVEIYHDRSEGVGDWPIDVKEALDSSHYMISVWSPSYFNSDWCLSEFHSIKERERYLGLAADSNRLGKGLCYPIVFCDGENFPEEVKLTERKDLST
ncbi:MAG: toll/interleukin-1 receptor domain-containing protein [Cyanobacteria bacterium P01_D01_bin.1]